MDRHRVFPVEKDIHGQPQITEVRWTDTVFTPEDIHGQSQITEVWWADTVLTPEDIRIDSAHTYLLALSLWKGCVERSQQLQRNGCWASVVCREQILPAITRVNSEVNISCLQMKPSQITL